MAKSISGSLVRGLVLLGVVGTPIAAFAQNWDRITDEITFSGASCQFSQPGNPEGSRTPPKLQNKSGATENVICPISRTRTITAIAGGSILTSTDVSPSTCKLRIRNWTDGVASSFDYSNTVNLGGNQQVRWSFGSSPGYTIGGNSSVAISCDLPDDASVLTYTFDSADLYHYF